MKSNEELIKYLIDTGFLKTPAVIEAFKRVQRENFVPESLRKFAYANEPLPLAKGQTISQPLTVAVMTEALEPYEGQKILEIGAGSGYQAALLAEIVGPNGKIITLERLKALYDYARERLKGYKNAEVINDDGTKGCHPYAPYDRIIVTASAPETPQPLLKQLKDGGKMVIPVKEQMFVVEKNGKERLLGYFAFVPLIGEHGWRI